MKLSDTYLDAVRREVQTGALETADVISETVRRMMDAIDDLEIAMIREANRHSIMVGVALDDWEFVEQTLGPICFNYWMKHPR